MRVAGFGSAARAKAGRRDWAKGEAWRVAVERKRCEVAGALQACLRRLGRMIEAIVAAIVAAAAAAWLSRV